MPSRRFGSQAQGSSGSVLPGLSVDDLRIEMMQPEEDESDSPEPEGDVAECRPTAGPRDATPAEAIALTSQQVVVHSSRVLPHFKDSPLIAYWAADGVHLQEAPNARRGGEPTRSKRWANAAVHLHTIRGAKRHKCDTVPPALSARGQRMAQSVGPDL